MKCEKMEGAGWRRRRGDGWRCDKDGDVVVEKRWRGDGKGQNGTKEKKREMMKSMKGKKEKGRAEEERGPSGDKGNENERRTGLERGRERERKKPYLRLSTFQPIRLIC